MNIHLQRANAAIEKLPNGDERNQLEIWINNHAPCICNKQIHRLVLIWISLIDKEQFSDEPGIYYCFFCLLAKQTEADLLKRQDHDILALVRTLEEYPTTQVWNEVKNNLTLPVSVSVAHWHDFKRRLTRQIQSNTHHTLSFYDAEPLLQQILSVIKAPNYVAVSPHCLTQPQFSAFTDKASIYLPANIAAPNEAMCQWIYIRLLAHELAHHIVGTFEISFKSKSGRKLFKYLKPFRTPLYYRLKKEAISQSKERIRDYKINDMEQFYLHFTHQELIQFLYNLCEDFRCESLLRTCYPGIAQFSLHFEDYIQAEQTYPGFLDSKANLVIALIHKLYLRNANDYITETLQRTFDDCMAVIDKFISTNELCSTQSAHTAAQLYQILEPVLIETDEEGNTSYSGNIGHLLKMDATDSFISFPQTIQILKLNDEETPLDRKELEEERELYADQYEDTPLPVGDNIYPEFSRLEQKLMPNSVLVNEKVWPQPDKKINIIIPNSNDIPQNNKRAYLSHGIKTNPQRVHNLLANINAGFCDVKEQRVFVKKVNQKGQKKQVKKDCIFFIDLTVSMKNNYNYTTIETPIERTLNLLNQVVPILESQGVAVEIVGVHDNGKKSVNLYLIKPKKTVFTKLQKNLLTSFGLGGFRIGACIRHYGWQYQLKGSIEKPTLIFLTDTGSHYLRPLVDETIAEVNKTDCSTCEIVKLLSPDEQCPHETYSDNLLIKSDEPLLYYSLAYELSDIKHALNSHFKLNAFFIYFSQKVNEKLLNKYLEKQWDTLSNKDDYDRNSKTIIDLASK